MQTLNNYGIGITGAQLRAKLNADNVILQDEIQADDETNFLKGKKLVTLGDSVTGQCLWQPTLAKLTEMVWSQVETQQGTGGHAQMGMGASKFIPAIQPIQYGQYAGQSIYARADDVHFYSPDVIIMQGGVNDSIGIMPVPDDITHATHPIYTGPEQAFDSGTLPSFTSAYKGTIRKLQAQNQGAMIYGMAILNHNGPLPDDEARQLVYLKCRDNLRRICELMGIGFIDLLTGSQMNPQNNVIFNDGHPTPAGGIRMARYIAKQFT